MAQAPLSHSERLGSSTAYLGRSQIHFDLRGNFMFSRFRMKMIVEIQGSDWDWLRLIAASGTARCMWWKVHSKNNLETLNYRTTIKSYRHTVQDHRQLLPLDSASSLVKESKVKWKQELSWYVIVLFTLCVFLLQFSTYHSCKGWPLFCLSSLVLLHCSPAQSNKNTTPVITDLHIYLSHVQDGPKASSKIR